MSCQKFPPLDSLIKLKVKRANWKWSKSVRMLCVIFPCLSIVSLILRTSTTFLSTPGRNTSLSLAIKSSFYGEPRRKKQVENENLTPTDLISIIRCLFLIVFFCLEFIYDFVCFSFFLSVNLFILFVTYLMLWIINRY